MIIEKEAKDKPPRRKLYKGLWKQALKSKQQKSKTLGAVIIKNVLKLHKCMKSGAGFEDVYKPNLKWYHVMVIG